MIVKILGVADLFVGIILFLTFLSVNTNTILLFCAFYLLVKFVVFSIEGFAFANLFDLYGAVIIFISLITAPLHGLFFLVAAILILQKAIVSLK
ncbi:MAG: hypothetical protein JSW08_00545 [archaeon]|nr:MAG: hypothetical protein JSW08_00545 [archaeon]